MFKSITFDNGTEFHGYQKLEEEYPITCYFATPYHSWERGTNENTNGLIRQYIPKGSCMKHITQKHCNRIAQILNNRPRKRHCYKTPAEVYYGKDSSLHLMFELKRIFLYSFTVPSFIISHSLSSFIVYKVIEFPLIQNCRLYSSLYRAPDAAITCGNVYSFPSTILTFTKYRLLSVNGNLEKLLFLVYLRHIKLKSCKTRALKTISGPFIFS